MEREIYFSDDEIRCEDKCTLEWVECVEQEDGALICRTHERNCFSDCLS